MYTTILVLLASVSLSFAQPNWMLTSRASAGPRSQMQSEQRGLYMFDTVAMISVDKGASWERIPGLVGRVCAIKDYGNGVSVAVTRDESNGLVRIYGSPNPASWNLVDSLSISNTPFQIATIEYDMFLAVYAGDNSTSKIYKFSTKVDSITLNEPFFKSLVAHETELYAATDSNVLVSRDRGTSWEKISTPHSGRLYVTNDYVFLVGWWGVQRLDKSTNSFTEVGKWTLPFEERACSDFDEYQGVLFVLTNFDGVYQVFRLSSDSVWTKVGNTLPQGVTTVSTSLMAIHDGRAFVHHNITYGFTDSAGVYSYDLNDFTSVDEDLSTGLSIRVQENTVHITSDNNGPAHVTIIDVLGRVIGEQHIPNVSDAAISLPSQPSGFLGVMVRFDNGTVQRGHLLY